MADKCVSYADWKSGRVQLTDQLYEPVFDGRRNLSGDRRCTHYRGASTGQKVGLWFEEVMDPPPQDKPTETDNA